MLKKLFTFLVISVIVGVFYTELTGRTNFRGMFTERVLGITQEQDTDKDGEEYKYKLQEKPKESNWDPAEAAIKDADSYHKEAKNFASQTKNTINSFKN